MAYQRVTVTLCFASARALSLDDVRAYVRGQGPGEVAPVMILWGELTEADGEWWTRELEALKRVSAMGATR